MPAQDFVTRGAADLPRPTDAPDGGRIVKQRATSVGVVRQSRNVECIRSSETDRGWGIGDRVRRNRPPPWIWWYQYYFATERGHAGYGKYRREFAKLIWQIASSNWGFHDATFERSAASFDNPDHVAIVIHNYRWRLGLAQGESKYDDPKKRLGIALPIVVPTITLEGNANGVPHQVADAYATKSSSRYAHRIVKGGIGQNLPQESPRAFAEAVMDMTTA